MPNEEELRRDKEIHYYDKLNGRDLDKSIVKRRLKEGMKSTVCVYMMYEVYEKFKSKIKGEECQMKN